MTDEATHEATREPAIPSIDPRLLEILVCPLTKTSLLYLPEKQELVSRAARLAFPIRDGVAVMLEDEARQLGTEEA